MRRIVFSSILLAAAAMAGPASADCTDEVAKAFEGLTKQKFLRKDTLMVSENGLVKMVLEFQLPDRMRQTVSLITDPKPVETIVVGEQAWTQDEKGWFELPPQAADEMISFLEQSTSAAGTKVGKFECIGAETLDGKQVRAYRCINEAVKAFGQESEANKNEAVRMVYINPETGLPARAIFAHKDHLDKPVYKEEISYPASLKIEPPANVQKPELTNPVKPLDEKK